MASKVFPRSLLLAGREMSTITSTKSTRISITPNILEEKTDSIIKHYQARKDTSLAIRSLDDPTSQQKISQNTLTEIQRT